MKIYHRAIRVLSNGDVSALCFLMPRKMKMSETWTYRDENVTCECCLRIIAENTARAANDAPVNQSGYWDGFDSSSSSKHNFTTSESTRQDTLEGNGGTFGGGGASSGWDSGSSSGDSGSGSSDGGGD